MNNSRVTLQTKFSEVKRITELKEVAKYLVGGAGWAGLFLNFMKIEDFSKMNWNSASIVDGLNYLAEVMAKGKHLYPIYCEEDYRKDKAKKEVNVIHFPVRESEKPIVILCAGGAYTSVCSLAEAYPVARVLNLLGYTVFVLNYRVGGKGLMPKPLDDLAMAIRFVQENRKEMNILSEEYIVAGFSAGGNLVSLWGTENHGYGVYNLPAPKAIIPVYPVVSPFLVGNSDENRMVKSFLETMFGKNFSADIMQEYDVLSNMGKEYPPCYIVCCEDDNQVPCANSKRLKEELDAKGIPAVLEIGKRGGHGFGEGRGTDAEGWIERAVKFIESL